MVSTPNVPAPTVHRHPLTAGPTAAILWVGSELLWVVTQFAAYGFLFWFAHVLTTRPNDDRALAGLLLAELLLVVGVLVRRRLVRAAQLHTPGALASQEPTAVSDVLRTRGPGWAMTFAGTVALAPFSLWLAGTGPARDRGPLLDATAGEVFLGLVLGVCWASAAVSLVRGVWDAIATRRVVPVVPQLVSLMGGLFVIGLLWPHATAQVRGAVIEVGGLVAVTAAAALLTVKVVRAVTTTRATTSAATAQHPLGEHLLTWWHGSATVTERARYAPLVERALVVALCVFGVGMAVTTIAVG